MSANPPASRPPGQRGASHLGPILLEEAGRVNPIGNGASYQWEPMEHQRRLVGVLEQQLPEDVEEDGQKQDATNDNCDLGRGAQSGELQDQWSSNILEKAHENRRIGGLEGESNGSCRVKGRDSVGSSARRHSGRGKQCRFNRSYHLITSVSGVRRSACFRDFKTFNC